MRGNIQSTMIRASAGSGKTWQLANRFLALMVLGVAPEKIIALTFTKKAAGEFTGRIMTRLAAGASDDQGAKALSDELRKVICGTDSVPALVTGPSLDLPIMDAAFFQGKLEELIASLDRLAMSTLDSYFVRIVRNFALELGLSGFDLMEDAAISAERMSVMTRIFSNQQTRKSEREAFLQAFKQATWGEEENRLCKTLEDFVKAHQNRWLMAPEAERWGGESLLWPRGCPYPNVDIRKSAKKLRDLLGPAVSPHKRYMDGWITVCDILEDYVPGTPVKVNTQLKRAIPQWSEYADGGLVDEKNKYEISLEIGAAMTELIGAYLKSEIEIRMRRTQGLHAIINTYEKSYHDQVRSRGRLCFSDLTLLLAGEGAMKIWEEESRHLIDYRLDARYDHWMLDEFQDTSQPQWKAVGNLVDEIMQDTGGERSVFVVGDGKQSIYGWRGGEPKLFDDLKKKYGERLADWDMDLSFRSSQRVLDLVNTVCDLSSDRLRVIFPDEAVDRWVYHTHEAAKEKQGHAMVLETQIDLKESSADEKTAARYDCMKSLIEKVDPLNQGLTCAILVSKNSQVAEVVEYLRSELPDTPVASESETVISDGPEGAAMLDFFRWLRNPAHHFGRLHIEFSPLHQIIVDLSATDDAERQWRWLTEQVSRSGVESLVVRLITALREQVVISAYGESRLHEILAAAHDFSVQGGSLNEWVLFLESRVLRETTREGMIQVMTVHKCKGLGFDVVILPELGSRHKFTDTRRLDALEKKGDLGATTYIIKKPANEICEADNGLKSMMDSWQANQCYERFCNLYVALTRAVHATYCIIDPVDDKWMCKPKYDDWIREATARSVESDVTLAGENYGVLYESGEWIERQEEKLDIRRVEGQVDQVVEGLKLQPGKPRMGRKVASGAKKYQAGTLLNHGKGMRFGNIVHQHFEEISWLDALPELDDQAAAELVRDCLKAESIRPHFERPASDPGDFQLLSEQPFETQHEGLWVSGIIDRAVIFYKNGKPTQVTIIDFKTDQGVDASSLRKKYAEQLNVYRQAVVEITGVASENVRCLLLSTALKEMVEV
ncbi:MAG: UvrD-helicase domain-containing protein [Verrucomicrobiae bacterium]|nr:UvrD-helicase domain-containing protein [Verrucomicrobiae bacterium]NNJ43219.1 UvrD-helicase domain-containing protein [Akkermansiaceae bacterium]